jgi:hypothetical protein
VLHQEPGGSRPLGEDAVECLGGALVHTLARAVQEAQAALSGPLGEPCEGAFGVPGVPFVDPGAVADEGDVPVAEVAEVVRAQPPATAKSWFRQDSWRESSGRPMSAACVPCSRRTWVRGSSSSTAMRITPSARPLAATRRTPSGPSSLVISRTSQA